MRAHSTTKQTTPIPVLDHIEAQAANLSMSGDAEWLLIRSYFALSAEAWDELLTLLDRPAAAKPRIAALLAEPSVLDRE